MGEGSPPPPKLKVTKLLPNGEAAHSRKGPSSKGQQEILPLGTSWMWPRRTKCPVHGTLSQEGTCSGREEPGFATWYLLRHSPVLLQPPFPLCDWCKLLLRSLSWWSLCLADSYVLEHHTEVWEEGGDVELRRVTGCDHSTLKMVTQGLRVYSS